MIRTGGLKIKLSTKLDPRKFSWKKKFGSIGELPSYDFDVIKPLETKDQQYSQICVAATVATACEAQFGMIIDELFQYAATKKIEGSINFNGSDPVDGCKSATKIGCLDKKDAPFDLLSPEYNDLSKYKQELILKAGTKKEFSFYNVDGEKDKFDSIRATMVMSMYSNFRTPVMVGAFWRQSWIGSQGGIITTNNPSESSTSHEFLIIGQATKIIDGKPTMCLKAHLSSSVNVGDKGCFYFPREIANKFLFALAFGPGNPEDNKTQLWNMFQKIYNYIYEMYLKLKI